MAISVTVGLGSQPPVAYVPGSRRRAFCQVTFDTSYPTGGYPLTAAQVGLTALDTVMVSGGVDITGTWAVVWDQTNSKLKLYEIAANDGTGTEEENGVDVHTGSIVIEAIGD